MSYYDDLGLPTSASQREIRDRYRELAMVAHPDHGGDPVVFRLLNEAYEVLGDPDRRRAYDAELAAEATGPAPSAAPEMSQEASDRWETTAAAWGSPGRGHYYAETFEGLASLSGQGLARLGRRVLISLALGAAVGIGIGVFTGQATALAFAFALPAAFLTVVAFGQATYRNGS